MASASVKLGVEYSQFKRGMSDAQNSVKTLTEALKANESQLKLTGDKEIYLKNKVDLLNQQIEAQRQVVANAMKALQELNKSGIDKASKKYQDMERNVYKATDQLNKMQAELKDVESGSEAAGTEAGEMNNQLKNIGKGVSWDNLTTGLDSIIGKLESGARAAVNLGKKIINSAKGSTGWADDLITLSSETGLSLTELQQIEQISHIIETDVDAIVKAKDRMAKATTTDKGVESIEDVLGISLNGQTADELFWEVGDALANMGEEFDKDAAAQQVFGRSWRELLPLFKMGRQEYEKMLSEQTVLTDEQVKSLGEADDAMKSVELQIQQMKNQFWAENADKITELMQWIVDNKDAVVTALEAIGIAFGTLKLASFAANLAKAINGFKELGLLGKGGGSGNQMDVTQAGRPGGTYGSQAAQSGGWLVGIGNAVNGAFAKGAAALTMYDPTGLTALIPSVAADKTTFGRTLRDGGDLGEAIENSWGTIQASAKEGLQNFTDYFSKDLQNGMWGILGIKDAADLQWQMEHGAESVQRGLFGSGEEHQYVLTEQDMARAALRLAESERENARPMDRMAQVAGEMNGEVATMRSANDSMAAAVRDLSVLPANLQTAITNAVIAGMNSVTIVINEGAVSAVGERISYGWGGKVQAMTK